MTGRRSARSALALVAIGAATGLGACGDSGDRTDRATLVRMPRLVAVDTRPSDFVQTLAFDRGGGLLAFTYGVRAVRPDGQLGDVVLPVGNDVPLTLSPDGRTLIVHGSVGRREAVIARSVARGGKIRWRSPIPESIFGDPTPHWSGDGTRLLIETESGSVVLDVASGRRVGTLPATSSYHGAQPLSADGREIVQGTSRGLRIRPVRAGGAWRKLTTLPALGASWSPDGRTIAAESRAALILVDAATGRTRRIRLPLSISQIGGIHWSPDSRQIAVTGDAGTRRRDESALRIVIVDARTGRAATAVTLDRSLEQSEPVAWSARGDQLAYWREQGGRPG
jgi:Tol biopolymer transport system component